MDTDGECSFYLLVALAGALDEEYTITCELPSDKVGLLIGKRGEDVQRTRSLATVWQHCDPIVTQLCNVKSVQRAILWHMAAQRFRLAWLEALSGVIPVAASN